MGAGCPLRGYGSALSTVHRTRKGTQAKVSSARLPADRLSSAIPLIHALLSTALKILPCGIRSLRCHSAGRVFTEWICGSGPWSTREAFGWIGWLEDPSSIPTPGVGLSPTFLDVPDDGGKTSSLQPSQTRLTNPPCKTESSAKLVRCCFRYPSPHKIGRESTTSPPWPVAPRLVTTTLATPQRKRWASLADPRPSACTTWMNTINLVFRPTAICPRPAPSDEWVRRRDNAHHLTLGSTLGAACSALRVL